MQASQHRVSRRMALTGAAGTVLLGARALAQQPAAAAGTGTPPPSVISNPPRQWGHGAPPVIYPDPDVIVVDPAFRGLRVGNAPLRRVWTGFGWAEGPAWSSQGQYLVFSDVTGDTQYRLLWDDRRVTPFRKPSFNSNGNSFDFQGRQLSTQDFNRRVVRWEHDGTMTVIADSFEGKPLNSPNDLVPHPDGSIWFTDPPYGDQLAEGHPDEPGGPANPGGRLNPRIGAPDAGVIGGRRRELETAVYRWDPSGRLDMVITEAQVPDPN
ncbi:MAG: SMP-30/gluconolactonase/LRE family protein, partial [Proteobacteria bacterium]|nr:SMP-30/gluconolactonase/LRE family protein [Pseudomonadota bacterium]